MPKREPSTATVGPRSLHCLHTCWVENLIQLINEQHKVRGTKPLGDILFFHRYHFVLKDQSPMLPLQESIWGSQRHAVQKRLQGWCWISLFESDMCGGIERNEQTFWPFVPDLPSYLQQCTSFSPLGIPHEGQGRVLNFWENTIKTREW